MHSEPEKGEAGLGQKNVIPEETSTGAEPVKSRIEELFDIFLGGSRKEKEEEIKKIVSQELGELCEKHELGGYNIIVLFDTGESINEEHANRIYEAFTGFKEHKDILLLVESEGGFVGPAYLISKTCKTLKKKKFVMAVPRKAKSAATLIALGADEIHMGLMSELGPVDPQIGNIPALALSNAFTKIAELVCTYPGSSDMFATYLKDQLDLRYLGYFERINESAVQYASRLLEGKNLGQGWSSETLAKHLVDHYKDHSFVIDVDESRRLLGNEIVKQDSREYQFAGRAYQFLKLVARLAQVTRRMQFSYVGSLTSGFRWTEIQ
jgi:Serine dehydrogenase proteinase